MRSYSGHLYVCALALGLVSCAADEGSTSSGPSAPRSFAPVAHAGKEPPPGAFGSSSAVPLEACSDTGDGFEAWLDAYREHAVAQGIPRELATHALGTVHYDPNVIELDRAQRPHAVPLEKFVATHVTPARIRHGKKLLAEHAALFARIDTRFGVAPEIVVALWGLETDFGAYQGNTRSLDALATLAHDCRRSARFRDELGSALRILQHGDLTVGQMKGAWAGELGQTQFLPSSYEHYGVDFDGDGRIDLIDSVDDALGSTASYLAGHGWHPHESYGAGTANDTALASWNESAVYRSAVVLFAEKLAAK